MENHELQQVLLKRQEAQKKLLQDLKGMQGFSPMSVLTGGFNFGGIAAQFEHVAQLNDVVITELALREIQRNGQ